MKDRIFIAWSGSNEIALKIQKLLKTHDYECIVGGNADNTSKRTSVGDTVLQQLNKCNQAIVIFKNRADGSVSDNLYFELGYALATYGQTKVHCVKDNKEIINLPSDFDNSFIEPIEGETDDLLANKMTDYFLARQNLHVDANKMYLIDNRYIIHDMLQRYNSEEGPKCSDYELAQYVMFYMQAANIFGDVPAVKEELIRFKQASNHNLSDELELAVNLSLAYFDLVSGIKAAGDGVLYIDDDTYFETKKHYDSLKRKTSDEHIGVFYDWARIFVSNHICYSNSLYAHCPDLDIEDKQDISMDTLKWADISLQYIDILKSSEQTKKNNDHKGFLSLVTAYVERNKFLAYCILGEEKKSLDCLDKSIAERMALKESFAYSSINTLLIENLDMEYYLTLTEYLTFAEKLDLSRAEKKMYLSDIKKYLQKLKDAQSRSRYIEKIEYIYGTIANQN